LVIRRADAGDCRGVVASWPSCEARVSAETAYVDQDAIRRYERTARRLDRLRVPRRVQESLAGTMIRRDVRIRGDEARYEVGDLAIASPRRFLPHFLSGPYEPELVGWLARRLPRDGIAIDAGAHIGYLSLVMAQIVGPAGRVYAIEPALESIGYLAENIRRNGAGNVEVLPVALADEVGLLRFNLNSSSDSFGFYEHPNTATVATRDVVVLTLDALFGPDALPRLDLLKIDVEGAEPEALEGAAALLRRFPAAPLVVEWFPAVYEARGVAPDVLPALLRDLGRSVEVLDPMGGGLRDVDEITTALRARTLPRSWYCNLAAQRPEQ
jgi:FkbM family methyltransferase